jgi:hypothetical protein
MLNGLSLHNPAEAGLHSGNLLTRALT